MKIAAVIVASLLTSVVTTVGVLYGAHRYGHLLAAPAPPQPVPELVGLSEADAQRNLDALGLKLLVAGREPDPKAVEGTVIAQAPKPGERLGAGEAVSLTFALAVSEVPDVIGKPVSEARSVLEGRGYQVKIDPAVASDDLPKDTVVAQTPLPGAALQTKETVTLQPSAGPASVEVPKLLGLGLEKAKKEAEEAGLELAIQWVALAETATGVVLSQDPRAGETVAPAAKVTVSVNRP